MVMELGRRSNEEAAIRTQLSEIRKRGKPKTHPYTPRAGHPAARLYIATDPNDSRVGQPRREKGEESFTPVEITGGWVRAEKGIGGRIVLGWFAPGPFGGTQGELKFRP